MRTSGELQKWVEGLVDFEGVLSLIGTCKNAGKTTLLNFLNARLPAPETAVTSPGRDGERWDILQGHAKPAIFLRDGAWFATAEQALQRSEGEWAVERATSLSTPLGRILLARVKGAARIELAGPSTVTGLGELTRLFRRLGVRRIVLDSAFDRVAGASSRLASATVLAAGSAGHGSVEEVVRATFNTVRRYRLPVFSEDRAGEPAEERASLSDLEVPALSGTVVLPDPSSCLLDPISWSRLEQRRIRLFVRRQVPLIGVFTSSFRPSRPDLDPEELLRAVRERCRPIPVFDLMLEGVLDDAEAHAGSNADR